MKAREEELRNYLAMTLKPIIINKA